MNKTKDQLIFVFQELIQAHRKRNDSEEFYVAPLKSIVLGLENGSFPKKPKEEQAQVLLGIKGQYVGKGEVMRRFVPDQLDLSFQEVFRAVITDYLEQLQTSTS